ncbi:MAG: hypothetical protein FJ012_03360 [Chloroflexi bacterium]|nr:hypothetical protein [Chloroflexota bacterium]
MSRSNWNQILVNLKNELASMKGRAEEISNRFETLTRQAELLKIELLEHSLEEQRRSEARRRGMVSLIRGKKNIGTTLAVGLGGLILGGLVTRDKYVALNTGMSALDGMLQGYGATQWAVSLGKEIVVTSKDELPSKGTWVTLESLKKAIEDLKREASEGQQLGSFDNVIHRLKQSRKLIYFGTPIYVLGYTRE